jgi:hypothetical protein
MAYSYNTLDGTEDINSRVVIAGDSNTSPALLKIMAGDEEFRVLVAILNNTSTPSSIIELVSPRIKQHPAMKQMCPLLWNHISTFTNGDVRMCCEMIDVDTDFGRPRDVLGNIMTVHSNTFDNIRNSQFAKNLRTDLLNGIEPLACRQCYHREQLGMSSKRLDAVNQYGHEMIGYLASTDPTTGKISSEVPTRYLDIRFGNLCNQKCRMCGPTDSSLWYDDHANVISSISGKEDNIPLKYYGEDDRYFLTKTRSGFKPNTSDFQWKDDTPFWKDMISTLSTIDRFYFTGGEPMINKQHRSLIELCVSSNHAKNIILDYHSNFQAISNYLIDIWREFKLVHISASIDGVASVQEYIRAPSKWSSISDNIINLSTSGLDNLSVKISPTISVLNILTIPDLSNWTLENANPILSPNIGNHMLCYPDYFSVQVLPMSVKHRVKQMYDTWILSLAGKYDDEVIETYTDRMTNVIDYMMEQDNSHLLPQLMEVLETIDTVRGENYRHSLPVLSFLLSFESLNSKINHQWLKSHEANKPAPKNIIVVYTPRSGSSYVYELIYQYYNATNPEITYNKCEPFSTGPASPDRYLDVWDKKEHYAEVTSSVSSLLDNGNCLLKVNLAHYECMMEFITDDDLVVYVYREDAFDQICSLTLAAQTGIWNIIAAPHDHGHIALDEILFEKYTQDIKKLCYNTARFDYNVGLAYEHLTFDYSKDLNLLGFDRDVSIDNKTITTKLQYQISNIDSLREIFDSIYKRTITYDND